MAAIAETSGHGVAGHEPLDLALDVDLVDIEVRRNGEGVGGARVKQAARGWAITPAELQLEMKTAAHRQSRGCILACRLSKNKILHHKDNQAENL